MPTSQAQNRIDLIPASAFSFEELTEAYNHTRVDYMVPMPMNANKLREYVLHYDIDMKASAVAVDGNEMLGLAMLGLREKRAWITRLGVIRSNRRRGTGTALVDHLMAHAEQKQADRIIIEVIKDNVAAHTLFSHKGFVPTRELLVLRRPPGPPRLEIPPARVEFLGYTAARDLLAQRTSIPSWIDETESLLNVGNLAAIKVSLADGAHGWLVYQNTIFQLGRIVVQTDAGDPLQVGRALLYHLHQQHQAQDTKTENLPLDDPHWPVFKEMGYLVMFHRIEMVLKLTQSAPES